MSLNIALEREQQQRVANYVAALDSQREYESIEAIKRQGREDGLSGLKPFDPCSRASSLN